MGGRELGIAIMVLGVAAIVIGGLIWAGAFAWFGRLPGDIRIENANTRVYIPLASMLLLSVVASLVVGLLRRLF